MHVILTKHFFAAFEQNRGVGALCRPGEAQRLSSLTFGCFQTRGKNPQVLPGPEAFLRTPCSKEETQGGVKTGKSSYNHTHGNVLSAFMGSILKTLT